MIAPAFPQEVTAIGPWRVGTIHNNFDNIDVIIVSNISDSVLGAYVMGFRCSEGQYYWFLARNGDPGIFEKGRQYEVKYRIDNGYIVARTASAVTDKLIVFRDTISLKSIYDSKTISFRTALDNGDTEDSSFSLTSSRAALGSIERTCAPMVF
jgi:hypothetical protein